MLSFATDANWILINPLEKVISWLVNQSKNKKLNLFLIYQDLNLKDKEGTGFNRLEELIPIKSYYFIDTLTSLQEFTRQIPENSFIIIPNKIGDDLDGNILDENKIVNYNQYLYFKTPSNLILSASLAENLIIKQISKN